MVRPMEDENPAICTQFESPGNLDALLPQLEQAIETAMASSTGRTGTSPQSQGKSSGTGTGQRAGAWRPRRGVLARLEVVRGVPFYGYHGEEKLFVKVFVGRNRSVQEVSLTISRVGKIFEICLLAFVECVCCCLEDK